MRIVAGELKGRKLLSPRSGAVRPTSDRVREAVFSLLGDVVGARVLDLYAGSGALGIEALSRGAREAVFVDSGRGLRLEDNLERLALTARAKFFNVKVERFLAAAARRGETWDLAFVDPPYRLAPRIKETLERMLPPLIDPNGRVVVESGVKEPLDLSMIELVKRRHGDTLVAIYRSQS